MAKYENGDMVKSLTSIFKALSDKNRLLVVSALIKYEELCACQIIELLKISGATVSRHMSVLMDAELVTSRKEGRWVHYRLNMQNEEIDKLFKWVSINIEKEDGTEKFFEMLDRIASKNPEEVCSS